MTYLISGFKLLIIIYGSAAAFGLTVNNCFFISYIDIKAKIGFNVSSD